MRPDEDRPIPAMTNPSAPPTTRVLLLLVAVTLGLPALVALVVTVWRPVHGSWRLVGVLFALFALGLVASRRAGRRGAKWLLAACAVALVLVWPEIGLRAAGFRFDQAGWVVFGSAHPDNTVAAQRDPDLFWTLAPERPDVNSHGFLGREFTIPKPRGHYRIVFLGDSCTMQGYPVTLERMLNLLRPDTTVYEAVNLAVAGYTSHQGLVVARRWLPALEPDLVVVYFGWNDHWRAYVATDTERSRWYRKLWTGLVSSSRIFQTAVWAGGPQPLRRIDRPRVSLVEYRTNLEEIREAARAEGAEALFLTAPSSYEHFGVPDYIVAEGFAPTKEAALEEHRLYNLEVTRLTRERGWPLLDLAGAVRSPSAADRIFLDDGIHFSEKGLSWIAGQIFREVYAASADQAAAAR
jgi:lysophospholipase L1-like esterase